MKQSGAARCKDCQHARAQHRPGEDDTHWECNLGRVGGQRLLMCPTPGSHQLHRLLQDRRAGCAAVFVSMD
jgi:hypothetical protein